VGSNWKSPADNFSKCGEVRRDLVELLCPSGCDSESGHHLVKYQYDLVLIANRTEPPQEPRLRRHAPHIPHHRFNNDGCYLARKLMDKAANGIEVVVRCVECVACDRRRDTRAVRNSQRRSPGPGFDEERVRVAVITSLKFYDLIFTSVCPGKPD